MVAGTAAWAEVFTKVAFARPPDAAIEILERRWPGGLDHNRQTGGGSRTAAWKEFAAMNEKVWWYLSRSSGIVAMVLLVASMVWGVLLATRALKPHDRPAWLLDLHRWLGGMALAMTGLHMLGLVLDGYVTFGSRRAAGARQRASTDRWPVALGVLSMYVMIAIQASLVHAQADLEPDVARHPRQLVRRGVARRHCTAGWPAPTRVNRLYQAAGAAADDDGRRRHRGPCPGARPEWPGVSAAQPG